MPQDNVEQYVKKVIDGIDLYIQPSLIEIFTRAPEISINVERTFFSKKLVVYGVTLEE